MRLAIPPAVSPRTRSLWPREHGAYVQLAIPLIAAVVIAPSVAGALIAIGAACAFLASEPLRVLTGLRGARMQQQARARASRRLTLTGGIAMIAGVTGLALAPPSALVVATILAILTVVIGLLAYQAAVATTPGEILVAVTLAGTGVPVALAGGLAINDALFLWSMWSVGFATMVVAVQHVLERHRRAVPSGPIRIGVWAAAFVIAGVVVLDARALTALALALGSALLVTLSPRATRLKEVGVAFTIAAVIAAGCAITVSYLATR